MEFKKKFFTWLTFCELFQIIKSGWNLFGRANIVRFRFGLGSSRSSLIGKFGMAGKTKLCLEAFESRYLENKSSNVCVL